MSSEIEAGYFWSSYILDEKEVQAMEHGKILAIYKMSSEIEAGYFWSSYIPRANGPQNV
jgi:uncharacterized protein involved in tolerance to divalent cations